MEHTKIDTLVEDLVTACGFNKSELASENFIDLLLEAAREVKKAAVRSRKEDYCAYDCTHALAGLLEEKCTIPV